MRKSSCRINFYKTQEKHLDMARVNGEWLMAN